MNNKEILVRITMIPVFMIPVFMHLCYSWCRGRWNLAFKIVYPEIVDVVHTIDSKITVMNNLNYGESFISNLQHIIVLPVQVI